MNELTIIEVAPFIAALGDALVKVTLALIGGSCLVMVVAALTDDRDE